MNKLDVDVLTTRQHWYAEWVLLAGSPRILVRRSSVAKAGAFDALIESGAAVPITRNKKAVCDSMVLVHDQYPYLEFTFLCMLESEPQGWEFFLEAAAQRFIHHSCGSDAALEDSMVQMWKVWFKHRLPCKVKLHSPWFFFTALVETEQFVVRLARKSLAFPE